MLLDPINIGSVRLANRMVLAPMSGVTNRSFRKLLHELNHGLIGMSVTEFVSVEAIVRDSQKTLEMMRPFAGESPFCIQIFGHDIANITEAAKVAVDLGAQVVDLNCGCPAPKVVKKGGGCELMRQPEHLAKVLRSMRRALSVPLMIKFRSGWDHSCKNFIEIGQIAESEGIDAITVHGRTRSDMYRGDNDITVLGDLKNAVKIPVFGSGDAFNYAKIKEMFDLCGVDGVYVARGALENPFVFLEILQDYRGGYEQELSNVPLLPQILLRYMELLQEDYEERFAIGRVKQLANSIKKAPRFRAYKQYVNDFIRIMCFREQQDFLHTLLEIGSTIGVEDDKEPYLKAAN